MDVDCLARLRELAESELTMKKQIADLERREETYMRTLQHADEMWSKMDGDAADTLNGLQEQLDTKTNANQQLAARICELEDELEKLRARMALCRSELSKYVSAGKIDTLIGREDDYAETTDKMVGAGPKVVGKGAGRDDDLAEVRDKDTWATVDVSDKEVSSHLADQKTVEMTKYLAMMGSMEELYYDDDYGVCGPAYACYEDWPGMYGECSTTDIASTPAISQKVSRRISQQETKLRGVIREVDIRDSSRFDEDSIEGESAAEIYEEVIEFKDSEDDTMIKTAVDKDDVLVPLSKLQSWVDTVDSIRLGISKGSASSVVKENVDTLAEEIAAYAGVKAKEVITEILPGLDESEVDEEEITEKVVEEFEADVEEEVETAPKVEDLEEEPIMTEVEPAVEPPVEVDVELAVEPPVEVDVELAVEPAVEADVELAVEPADEVAVEPPDEVAVELAVEPADEVAVEPADKVAVELAVEPADEVAIKPAVESAVELAVEPVSLVSDTVAPVEAVEEMKKPEEEMEKQKVEVEVKESPAESIEPAPEEVETELEKDIVADEETKTILPIQQLTEEEEVEEETPPIEVPAAEVTVEGEETKVDVEPSVDEDAIQEEVELESVEEIEVEKVLPIETEEIIADIGEEVLEELPEEPIPTELTEEKEEIEDTELAVLAEESTTEIEAVEDAEQPVEPGVPAEISETIQVKEEIPMEEVPLEEKIEEAAEGIPVADEELLKMEEMAEIKEEMPVLEEEEIKDTEDIVEEIRETVPSAAEVKPEIKKRPEVPIDSKIVAMPYLAVADIEEIKEEPIVAKALPCVCKQAAEPTPSPTLPPMQIVITHAETVQTVINTGTQTCTVRPTPKKASCQRSIETDTRDPDISARKMRWRMRPKNRCAVASSNVSLQTEKSLLVLRSTTQDPCSSGRRLLSNILQSLKPSQSIEEKEIRTINYGQKHQQKGKCNCCLCGKEKTSSPAPPSFAKLSKARYQKTDQITQKGKSNYGMPRSGITDKWQTSQLRAPCVPKSVKQFSDQGICTHATSSCKSKLRMSYKRTVRLEMKDQSCSAKLPKSKVPSTELKKDEKLECSSTEVKRIDDERRKKCSTPRHTFDSPSTCMCTKTEKTPSGNILKQQICACGDSD
ncbi:hypothetical protein KPH14_009534 [Odynerus spinipes]|uniref:Uncharacterized protein n=1 Tax=Odynerus spinipes TaxID=1348599 RepID=A0AAD9VQP8_9HYME|nr:hypothetical protein KPH14_009534 [Odynerus spinipes]